MLKRLVKIQLLLLMVILTLNAQTKVMSVANKNGSLHNVKVSEVDSLKFLTDFVEDVDGNVYKTVQIGTQIWMAENLRVSHYNDGTTAIPYVSNNADWGSLTTGAYCCYDNDVNKAKTYGCLYNWYAVNHMNAEGKNDLAPVGWHVPTDEEWEELAQHISDQKGPYSKENDDWRNLGKHLKSTTGWPSGKNGTDDFGFAGLPAGLRGTDLFLGQIGKFYSMGNISNFWSATKYDSDTALFRYLIVGNSKFYRSYLKKSQGYSIRLLKD